MFEDTHASSKHGNSAKSKIFETNSKQFCSLSSPQMVTLGKVMFSMGKSVVSTLIRTGFSFHSENNELRVKTVSTA